MARAFLKRSSVIMILVLAGGFLLASGRLAGQGDAAGSGDPGREIYKARCAPCHGAGGKGDGPFAMLLSPRPRDFTMGLFEYRSTESGSIPTDDDLKRTVSNGLPGTAMPAWKKFITGDSLNAVIEVVKSFSARFKEEQPKPVNPGADVPSTPASIAAGKKVFDKLQCASCHGSDGKGTDATATGFENAAGAEIRTPDLTTPWNFRGGRTARDVFMRFRTGLDGAPMPSFAGSATNREMWDLANFIVSLARKPAWEMTDAQLADYYQSLDGQARKDPEKWGKYIVNILGCADCHTPLDGAGGHIETMKYAGGQKWRLGPYGDFVSYNLTSDKETGLGSWTDEEIKHFLTRGVRRDGSRMLPFPMPWTAYANLKADDLNAIVAYLRTLPPIRNQIPKPQPLNFVSYLWEKFRLLVLRKELAIYTYGGNSGIASSDSTHSQVSSLAAPAEVRQ